MKALVTLLALALVPSIFAAPTDRLVIGAEGKIGVAIVDPANDNALLWQRKGGAVHDVQVLENGNLLTQDGWKTIIEITPEKAIAWEYDAGKSNGNESLKRLEVHAIQRLENGNTMLAESGSTRIIEIDSSGTLIKEVPLQVSKTNGHSDTRRVRKLDNGHYLVAHEADQIVKEYDPNGKVVWEFPIPLFGKEPRKGHGPEGFGGKCFAAIKAKNGNYLITTGNGHSVLEVTPEKEIVWKLEQNDLPGVTLAWVTTIDELENGNLMIGNCHAGPENPQIIEITRDKEIVWSFKDFETFGNALSSTFVLEGDDAARIRKLYGNP